MQNLQIVTAVNNEKVLKENLLCSPMIANNSIPVFIARGYESAAKAYNAWIKQNTRIVDYAIFTHQDVYFPDGWDKRLLMAVETLKQKKISWGVLGIWGIQASGRFLGKVWCNGGSKEHFGELSGIEEVVSIDEVVIVLNMESRIQFDEMLPGYHLYATDVILEAKNRGYKSFVFNGPVVHNSKTNPQVFDAAYFKAYRYMKQKWASILPLQTCVVPVTRFSLPLYKAWLRREIKKRFRGLQVKESDSNAKMMAEKLGYNLASQNTEKSTK